MEFWSSSSSLEKARCLLLCVMKLDAVDQNAQSEKSDSSFFPLFTGNFSKVPHRTQRRTV